MFSSICFLLDYVLEVLIFAFEVCFSLISFFVYEGVLPSVSGYISREYYLGLVVLVDGVVFFYLEMLFTIIVVYVEYGFY